MLVLRIHKRIGLQALVSYNNSSASICVHKLVDPGRNVNRERRNVGTVALKITIHPCNYGVSDGCEQNYNM